MIYEPAEDSYLLQKWVKQFAQGSVLDMGCGSGIQAKTAQTLTPDVLAADINPEAVAHCEKLGINAIVSDLFSAVAATFDVIIFNPPYLPRDVAEDDDSSLITTGGLHGSEVLERFLVDAKEHLAPNGRILFVCSSLTGDVEALMDRLGYQFLLLEEESHFFEKLRVYTCWL